MNPYIPIAVNLLTLAFAAGGAWFALKQSQKDVNGLGRKMGEAIKSADKRYMRLVLALQMICSDEQRAKIAELVKE